MKLEANKPVRITILSVPSHLPIVRAVVEKVCQMVGFDSDTIGNVMLSVDEALTNIIRHAYEGAGDETIEIEINPTGGANGSEGLQISLRDYGRRVDPDKIRSRKLEDIRPGGLGVHIIKECMDSVEYRHADGGGTVLTMTKMCKPHEGSKSK